MTKLIVALDVEKFNDAERLVKLLYPTVQFFKIGSQLFTACGQRAMEMVGQRGAKVFLDLKFHDIPQTVYSAVASGTASAIIPTPIPGGNIEDEAGDAVSFPVFMMTVHAQGGLEMMRFAADAAKKRASELKIEKPKIVAVTVLTSDVVAGDTQKIVLERALMAQETGLDGVVCSVQEAASVRQKCGKDFIIVTPGIRPAGAVAGDQKRVATPKAAKDAGSDFIVVGRPIVEADDPLAAAKQILKELE